MITNQPVNLINRRSYPTCYSELSSLELSYAFLKRITDITVALLLLVCSLPLMIIVAVFIKISSPGAVIYKQERCTKTGKVFWLYKFRSMPDNVENGKRPEWGKTDDPRCTKLGRLLRMLLIDELPQLINVLKGDMSLVGPRPERPYFIKRFRTSIKDYDLRHIVKAGLTGWAQVNGYRGNTSIVKRVEHDLFYIENRSVLFDLKIILMTPFSLRLARSKSKKKTVAISKTNIKPTYNLALNPHLCSLQHCTCLKNSFTEK